MTRRARTSLVVVCVSGCFVLVFAAWGARSVEGGRQADKARAINQALNGGPRSDWAAAAAAARRFQRDAVDGDAEAAALLLRSLADPRPATRPPGTAEDAYRRLETAAAQDPDHASPILESFLRYGVMEPRTDRVVLPADPAAADCWRRVRAHEAKAPTCIALRRSATPTPPP